MPCSLDDLATRFHAFEAVDKSDFRRRARLLQSMWRESQGYACGEHRGRPLGSRLVMPWAQETLANYLTDAVKDVVRCEVLDERRSAGKLYGKPRIFNDLLSSQPLAFNLFGELQADLELTSRVIERMSAGRFSEATAVAFEESPGRSDPRYTGDRSAFDVFIECRAKGGGRAFLGIEVKYHENLADPPAKHRARYDEVAAAMGCFRASAEEQLKAKPLQQVWRDHLLAGALLAAGDYADGQFVFLHPQGNLDCVAAVGAYRDCLSSEGTFAAWTLEELLDVTASFTDGPWVAKFRDRYLDFKQIDHALQAEARE